VKWGVTEHLPNYKTTIRKYELLKPGGTVTRTRSPCAPNTTSRRS
jgi:hypothetical protein